MILEGRQPAAHDVRSYGPYRPLVDGTSDSARAKNRRVQFIVTE
jgi:outer membrane protein OmpA-like peptidoglycan-associated protein